MAGYADVYALATARSGAVLARFLSRFAPAAEEAAEGYLVPQYADRPTAEFRFAAELVDYLTAHPDESQPSTGGTAAPARLTQ